MEALIFIGSIIFYFICGALYRRIVLFARKLRTEQGKYSRDSWYHMTKEQLDICAMFWPAILVGFSIFGLFSLIALPFTGTGKLLDTIEEKAISFLTKPKKEKVNKKELNFLKRK